jgi:L-sorbose 1-phosphate reductase
VLAAIGGMRALNDSLRAQLEGVYPGKIVIFPQLSDLPLIGLPELARVAPEVYARLGPNLLWTMAAERALFERYLP